MNILEFKSNIINLECQFTMKENTTWYLSYIFINISVKFKIFYKY